MVSPSVTPDLAIHTLFLMLGITSSGAQATNWLFNLDTTASGNDNIVMLPAYLSADNTPCYLPNQMRQADGPFASAFRQDN